ncbi:MAG: polysaccharide biosynthesis tyrosine autokinase [Gammaproteobacteria bacterium]|nr:polysaccharide biosynthesis tyrosine autokinase [Gammaproteobacteria bacterium]
MSTIERAQYKKNASDQKNPQVSTAATNVESVATNNSDHEGHPFININLNLLAANNMVTNSTERCQINEEYRFIKRKLLINAFGKPSQLLKNPNIILITSTAPNEGKTFTSINLALSIALEQDKTVLLIDADVVNPSIGKELEYESTNGLLDYLLGHVDDIGDVIYSTNIDKLKLLPSGSRHHLSHELLTSDRMEKLIEELATRYPDRVIILDSPPLLGVSETQVLSSLSGQAVVVIEEAKTKVSSVQEAVKLLAPELAIGFILNKSNERKRQKYGYNYGYGNYYGL